MAETLLGKLVQWGILVLFLIIFVFALLNPKTGLIQKISKLALGAERFLPDEPKKEVAQDESLPPATTSTQERFMKEIIMHDGIGECLLQYTSLSDLGDQIMELNNYEGGIQSMIGKKVGKEETGTVKLNRIQTKDVKLSLCVIDPQNFYDRYLSKGFFSRGDTYLGDQTYKNIASVTITNKGILFSTDCTFLVGGGCYSCGITANDCYPLEGNIIFKPTADKLCFIPTHRGDVFGICDAEEKSIDNGCIDNLKLNIPSCRSKAGVEDFKECESRNGRCVQASECDVAGGSITTIACPSDMVCCAARG